MSFTLRTLLWRINDDDDDDDDEVEPLRKKFIKICLYFFE